MRVTSEMMAANSVRRLSGRLQQYERVQSQLATGRRVLRASDDPSSAGRAMTLRTQLRANDQALRNAGDARAWLEVGDGKLQTAVQRLHRVRDLAVRGANALGASERNALALEVSSIREELRSIANSRYRGRPLFGGTSDADPVDPAGAVVDDGGAVSRRIGDATGEVVTVNVLASDAFGTGADSLFVRLDELETALKSGDDAGITAAIGHIDTARERLGTQLATVGATMNRVESADQRLTDIRLTLRGELAQVQDVDMAEAVVELQTQEVAYQATLGAIGRALPPSLVSFLR